MSNKSIDDLKYFSDEALLRPGRFLITEPIPICENELQINNKAILENTYYQAEKTIQSSAKIDSTMFITFQAGNSITLNSGFHAKKGANFTAEIKEVICEQTVVAFAEERTTKSIVLDKIETTALEIAPNPFYQSTTIKYNLPKDTKANLQIFSTNGELLKDLVPHQFQTKGNHEYTFEPTPNSSNIYLAVLITETAVLSKKMIFIR